MNTLYTVQLARNDDTLYGPSHGADTCYKTVCNRDLTTAWFITNNTYDGVITCKACIKILKALPTLGQRSKAND